MRLQIWGVLLVGLVSFAVSVAQGQPAPAADPDTEIARRHYEKGTVFYTDGKYSDAIDEFTQARKVKPLPAFDYNIARCHDRMEHVREAIAGYERYLAEIPPTDSDAAEVRARVEVLKRRLADTLPAPTSQPAAGQAAGPPEAVESPPTRHRRYTWIAAGIGGALLAGSLVAGLIADSHYTALKVHCAADGTCNSATAPDAGSWIDSGKSAQLASEVLLGVGAAAVAAGVVLFFVEGHQPAERRAWRITPTVDTHGGGLAFEVSL